MREKKRYHKAEVIDRLVEMCLDNNVEISKQYENCLMTDWYHEYVEKKPFEVDKSMIKPIENLPEDNSLTQIKEYLNKELKLAYVFLQKTVRSTKKLSTWQPSDESFGKQSQLFLLCLR